MMRKLLIILLIALCVNFHLNLNALPAHATVIDHWAYQNKGLTYVDIPIDVTEIGMGHIQTIKRTQASILLES